MTRDRAGGTALIVSAVLFIITMALHPTGREMLAPGQFNRVQHLAVGVHGLALICLPVTFYGALILSQRLEAVGALITYGFAVIAVMNAAVYSGFISTAVAGQMPDFFRYSGYVNQAYALVYVVASCAAIVLWSVAMLKQARGIGIAGVILGPLIVVAVLTHGIGLDVHGFGAIVLAQSVWFIACGVWLIRLERQPRID